MIYEYPDWVETFRCIADKCPDTCCAGWEVGVDEDTKQIYETAPEPIASKLRKVMRTDKETGDCYFLPAEKMRCPFLNEKNLCDIYIQLGPDALSMTCDEYPRYFNEIGDYQQMDMSLSCMEFGRIFFNHGDMVLKREEDDIAGRTEADNVRLLGILDMRDEMIGQMQTLDMTWKGALASLECVYAGDAETLFEETDDKLYYLMCSQEMLDAKTKIVFDGVGRYIRAHGSRMIADIIPKKSDEKEFRKLRKKIDEAAEAGKTEKTVKIADSGKPGDEKNFVEMNNWFRKLAVYFIFRYTLDVYKDRDIDYEFRFINRSLRFLELMCKTRMEEENRSLSVEDIIDIAHIYSRQVEHSEEIVEALKK
jgi:lysine-N-methylase